MLSDQSSMTTIRLWPVERDCGICGKLAADPLCVGWYCGPVTQEPGERVPGWEGEAVAGGMPVCRPCYNRHEKEMAE